MALPLRIVVMGVSGSGKSSLGAALGRRLCLPFIEGDDLHPPENVRKMSSGVPLTDIDRVPWLDAVAAMLDEQDCVVSCSALTARYRDRLRERTGQKVSFIYLAVSHYLVTQRLSGRRGHFMPSSLVGSQFSTLEPPSATDAIIVDGATPLPDLLDLVCYRIMREEPFVGSVL